MYVDADAGCAQSNPFFLRFERLELFVYFHTFFFLAKDDVVVVSTGVQGFCILFKGVRGDDVDTDRNEIVQEP